MIKAVIFDLDGVICFTDQYHYKAWKELADSIGVYFDEEINNRLRGVSRMASLEIILERSPKKYTEQEKEELAAKKNERYVEFLDEMGPKDLSGEVQDTLHVLREKGLKLAIGSSSKNTKKILEKIGLKEFFDAVSDGTNITRSKPDPEVFIKAAEMLGVKPEEALVVEDAKAGIDAACKGGFVSAGLGEAAEHPAVDHPLSSFAGLVDVLSV
ncbi:MAG: beta-phosphoglucomutase [Lachnospiraceae bacterium]|nr:beta-phosphoglucomutase [Lachnospiraceae bacterium]